MGTIQTATVTGEFPTDYLVNQRKQQLLDQAGEEADVVEAMFYLVSPRSRFMTGETLRISGGKMLAI